MATAMATHKVIWPLADKAEVRFSPANPFPKDSQNYAVYEIYKKETTAKRAGRSGADDNLLRHLFVHGDLEVKIDGGWISGTDCRTPVRLGEDPLWRGAAPAPSPAQLGAVPVFPLSPTAATAVPMEVDKVSAAEKLNKCEDGDLKGMLSVVLSELQSVKISNEQEVSKVRQDLKEHKDEDKLWKVEADKKFDVFTSFMSDVRTGKVGSGNVSSSKIPSTARARKGKGGAKGAKRDAEKKRELRFTGFQEDTPEEDIKSAMKAEIEKVDGLWDHVQEYFAFGRYTSAGAVRFSTETKVWDALADVEYPLQCRGQPLFIDVSYPYKDEGIMQKEKAIRKMRRVFYEDGKTRDDMCTNWISGLVMLDGVRVAKWSEETKKMVFTEAGRKYEAPHRTAMGL